MQDWQIAAYHDTAKKFKESVFWGTVEFQRCSHNFSYEIDEAVSLGFLAPHSVVGNPELVVLHLLTDDITLLAKMPYSEFKYVISSAGDYNAKVNGLIRDWYFA